MGGERLSTRPEGRYPHFNLRKLVNMEAVQILQTGENAVSDEELLWLFKADFPQGALSLYVCLTQFNQCLEKNSCSRSFLKKALPVFHENAQIPCRGPLNTQTTVLAEIYETVMAWLPHWTGQNHCQSFQPGREFNVHQVFQGCTQFVDQHHTPLPRTMMPLEKDIRLLYSFILNHPKKPISFSQLFSQAMTIENGNPVQALNLLVWLRIGARGSDSRAYKSPLPQESRAPRPTIKDFLNTTQKQIASYALNPEAANATTLATFASILSRWQSELSAEHTPIGFNDLRNFAKSLSAFSTLDGPSKDIAGDNYYCAASAFSPLIFRLFPGEASRIYLKLFAKRIELMEAVKKKVAARIASHLEAAVLGDKIGTMIYFMIKNPHQAEINCLQ